MIRSRFYRAAMPLAIALTIGSTGGTAQMASGSEGTLQVNMRKLWEDHVSWTRMYIISATANAPDKAATLDRLMKNQDDIGNAMRCSMGTARDRSSPASSRTTSGSPASSWMQRRSPTSRRSRMPRSDGARTRTSSRCSWRPRIRRTEVDDLKTMLHQHLDLTTKEVTAYLGKDWKGSIEAYDKVRDQALEMADALSSGIMKQFPQKAAM